MTECGFMGPGGHGCYLPAGHPVRDPNYDHKFPLCRSTSADRTHSCTHLKGHCGPCNPTPFRGAK